MLPANSLCMGGYFPVCCGLFPVIHIWAFVHHSSMFRVVDVLCAVCYTVAEDEWIFSSLLWIFTALHEMQTRSSDDNSVCLSVCLSVTRVIPDKMEERSFQIFIPHERTFILLF